MFTLVFTLFILLLPSFTSITVTKNKTSIEKTSDLSREYWAVLVGINNYPGWSSDLPWSVNEIKSFKKTLLNGGNWEESHIVTLFDENATSENIFAALEWLSSMEDKNDVSVFYFAGHGSKTMDGERISVYNNVIYDKELDEKLSNLDGRIVVILDSCFSGGFIEELGKKNRIVMTACGKNEPTYQVDELESGIFGYFVNKCLSGFTKTAEATFAFSCFLSIYYSKQLSEKFNQDYTIHPCLYDGCKGFVKIINHHTFSPSPTPRLSPSREPRIWRM